MIPRNFVRHTRWIAALSTWGVLLCSIALWACTPAWAEGKPGEPSSNNAPASSAVAVQWKPPLGVRVERDVPYVSSGDEAQRLDLYLPEVAAEKALPLIVYIHGGAWRAGSKFPCPVIGMVNKGYAVASVEYRFSQKALFPAQIQDCQAAIRWLRANSKRYNFDPEYVGVVGASAGGHLSALVGTAGGKQAFPPIGGNEEQSDRVQAVCDYYGPTNFATVMQQAQDDRHVRNIFRFNTPNDPYSSLIGMSLDADQQKTSSVSPVHYVSPDSPPMLILHGDYDALVPYAQSEELTDALRTKGVEAWLQKLPGSGHGGPAFGKPKTIALIQSFFDKHLKGTPVKFELIPAEDLAVEPPQPAGK